MAAATTGGRLGSYLTLTLALTLLAGCGDGRPPVYPVTGSVTYKGKPAGGAVVMLVPAGGGAYSPTGTVGPDGGFRLTTFAPDDGAPAGDYTVLVTWRPAKKSSLDPDGPDKLGNRYANAATSKLSATVEAKPTDLPPIALD